MCLNCVQNEGNPLELMHGGWPPPPQKGHPDQVSAALSDLFYLHCVSIFLLRASLPNIRRLLRYKRWRITWYREAFLMLNALYS